MTVTVRVPRWLVGGRGVLAAGAVLVALSVAAKYFVLRDAFFREDDFEYIGRAFAGSLDWEYLGRVHWGQFMPGGFALVWAFTRLAPYNWDVVVAATLAGHAAAGLAMLRMLRVVFGTRPAILGPLLVFLLTPLSLSALSWFAAALNTVPLQIAMPMAIASHVLYTRDGRPAHLWASAGWVLVGMAFFVKGALVPVVLLALTAAGVAGSRERGPWARVWQHRRAWLVHGTLVAGFAALFLSRLAASGRGPQLPSPGDILRFGRVLVTETFTTTALGGPGRWQPIGAGDAALAAPSVPVVVAAGALFAVLIAAGLFTRRAVAAWSWALLFGYLVLADVLPVALGRLANGYADIAGAETRYVADAAPLLALCLGLAFLRPLGAPETTAPARGARAGRVLAVLGLAGFTAASVWSSVQLTGTVDGERARAFLAGARASLAAASPDADVFDRRLPTFLMQPLFQDNALASRVLAPLAKPVHRETMRTQPPSADPLILDDRGALRPLRIWGETYRMPGGGCWPTRHDGATIPVRDSTGKDESYVVKLDYISGQPKVVTVRLGTGSVEVVLKPGLHASTFAITGHGETLEVTGDQTGASFQVCAVALGFGVAG
ncbi:hypothetical protein [Sphaerisporangium sp. TRM90804]|uniref:hypothetical protein n=1 Tax=Sphaerisporangium sp. TRM90804 TaxID=3031113 RepID=UPI00244B3684|nr:hypothetical protein [Sphaerisporangium sp. TRM90804]MDH2427900.1 hypothetical protein [Sphaerisporangium sp. TRM90804]